MSDHIWKLLVTATKSWWFFYDRAQVVKCKYAGDTGSEDENLKDNVITLY